MRLLFAIMANTKYDEILLGILKEEGQLMPFLDIVFGFFYRCTDFYQIQKHPEEKFGFPAGIAQNIVLKVFKKWEMQAREDHAYYDKMRLCSTVDVPISPAETVMTTTVHESHKVSSIQPTDDTRLTSPVRKKRSSITNGTEEKDEEKSCQNAGDSYNGAVCNGYRWSQTISDLDVQVMVPAYIKKGRNVQVSITATHLCVSVLEENRSDKQITLVDGELCWKTNKEDSLWSLVPGQYVQLHLEKSQELWWNALFTSEPKIDLKNIDASRHMDDLSQEEQMKIQELMWNQERKRQGLPTTEEMALESMLKEAWDKEGSPFKGRPFDPTITNISNLTSSSIQESGDN